MGHVDLSGTFGVDVEACGTGFSRVCVSPLWCAAGHGLPASSKVIIAKVARTNQWVRAYFFCRVLASSMRLLLLDFVSPRNVRRNAASVGDDKKALSSVKQCRVEQEDASAARQELGERLSRHLPGLNEFIYFLHFSNQSESNKLQNLASCSLGWVFRLLCISLRVAKCLTDS